MTIQEYIEIVSKRLKSGISREHSYRGDLEALIRELVKGVEITNEPANVTDCGNPDYVITKGKIPVGYIEAKDIGKDLNSKSYKEQFGRYKKALDNLIITDYVWFQFFQSGELVHEIRIGEIENNTVKPLADNFVEFENLIQNFCTHIGQTIKSSQKLAEMMASKARLLQNIMERAVTSDEETQENTSLQAQYETFKTILIHDLTPKDFADIYAQTLAYGMFAARLHDKTLDDFSRQEAAELIPKTNPFLRKLFGYVAGPDIDERIVRTVDNLADVFRATNVDELLHNFGKSTQTHDPIIHFYETFLSEYDPKLRKARGVWYTPAPVVNFIVRAVDDILKTEFDLPQGLADTTKTKIKVEQQGKKIEKEVHKVQILDPATGTGTFLAEVVKYIYSKRFKAMQGAWSGYVEEHLIPRLNGFELLMASYSMAHLKLDMLLTETGYKSTKNKRFNIYLTNSLEEHHPDTGTLFSQWLSAEANEANHIKRDTPVMVVMGNPPYAVSSSNKGEWIMGLMDDYKKEPGGKEKLKERNPKVINDDYVKFLRYGQYYIEKNGKGVLAFINPHGYLDNPTFRGMRWNLLKAYDKIYTIDLHGNSKKKEVCPDGSPDQNVFDIMQGVSINLFVKTGKKKANELGKVFHFDLYGKREKKYDFLWNSSIKTVSYVALPNIEPSYFFVQKDFSTKNDYDKGFKITEIFNLSTSGVKTHRDAFVVDMKLADLKNRIRNFYNFEKSNEQILSEYNLKASLNWLYEKRKGKFKESKIKRISYRAFDDRWIYYSNDIVDRGRENIFNQTLHSDNYGFLTCRQQSTFKFQHAFITRLIADMCTVSLQTKEGSYYFPLYLYPDESAPQITFKEDEKTKLKHKLEQAEEHFKKVSKYFNKTVEPFYNKLANPNEAEKSLFEENRSLFEEAETAVESLKSQIANVDITPKTEQNTKEQPYRVPNLNMEIVSEIAKGLGLEFVAEKDLTGFENLSGLGDKFAPIDILDYIYAVLHSPTYREKYKEFLKIDFPRVPYPKNVETFWQLVKLGGEIRQIHLLESPKVEEYITGYPIDGDNKVTTKIAKKNWEITGTIQDLTGFENLSGLSVGRIWINETQYFENIPLVAWEFYIGGYQPAQKWLKDRSPKKGKEGRVLGFEDILHYQKIIVALTETDRLMKEIDEVGVE